MLSSYKNIILDSHKTQRLIGTTRAQNAGIYLAQCLSIIILIDNPGRLGKLSSDVWMCLDFLPY